MHFLCKASSHCFRVIVQLTLESFRRSDERCESPDCRSVEISGSSRHLSWHADEHASRPEDDDWLWSSNPAIRRRKAGGVAASRESSLQFVSAPSACASIGAISNPSSGGRARNRIASGGRTS